MKHLFLDLEDTVITPVFNGWGSTELINQELVKDTVSEFKPDFVNIFSFALHNLKELSGFNANERVWLEKSLGVTFRLVPVMDKDIIPTCCKAMDLLHPSTVSFEDACAFWSKHQAFRLFCKQHFGNMHKTWNEDTEVLLLDDIVMNETWEWPDLRIKGKIVKV